MKKLLYAVTAGIGVMLAPAGFSACKGASAASAGADSAQFVRVENGEFRIGDSVYRFVGTNFWYGAILASEGRGGDRARLARELDLMQRTGIDNVRVLVGADGDENQPNHVMPVLQTAPGVYNDTILDGLDYLMAELEKRGMKAVLFLNNAWEWSGGYGTYLEWAGAGHQPNPAIDGYPAYMEAMAAFCTNDSAKTLAIDHARRMASRTNRYTGRPYAESPAIMSWQVANEPRAFSGDSAVKAAFADYIIATARAIKAEDPNHMVSTGSEGLHGCEYDMALWRRIHEAPEIDYGILHLWPYNWSWIDSATVASGVDTAFAKAVAYITPHYEAMRAAGKPLVLEEFGYPRDNMATAPGSATTGRDGFYSRIFNLIATSGMINGCNFWGWGGYAMPPHKTWQPWDPYTGDPAQEPQGLNSVFAADSSTLAIIRSSVDAIKNARHE